MKVLFRNVINNQCTVGTMLSIMAFALNYVLHVNVSV